MKKFEGCILISDMDATLLKKDHSVSERNIEAIRYFTQNGGKFTVASGRMCSEVAIYRDMLDINAPAILHNGAMVYDFLEEKVLFERNIEEERKADIIRAFEATSLGVEVYSEEVIYVYRPCKATERFLKRKNKVVYSFPDEALKKPWIKCLIIGDTSCQLDEFEPIYRKSFDGGNAVRSGALYLDVVANGVSKGESALLAARSCRANKIIAVGDSANDIELLKIADMSFAVVNAKSEVKAVAKYNAPSNEDDAIAYIIEKICRQ